MIFFGIRKGAFDYYSLCEFGGKFIHFIVIFPHFLPITAEIQKSHWLFRTNNNHVKGQSVDDVEFAIEIERIPIDASIGVLIHICSTHYSYCQTYVEHMSFIDTDR